MISKQQIEQLGASLGKLGARRLSLLGGVGIAIVATIVIAASYLGRPAMQPLYTGLTAQDVTRMAEALAEAGVPFDVNEQRNAVLVAFGQTARARALLVQKGLPTSARAGYELFDNLGSMGLTSFMQEVTKVRALEGEISRTLQALDGVAAARVHLVLPDPGSLRRERREPSGSVLLRLDARWQPQTGQAVRHLVAAAVPGMKTEQVSVASSDGRLIASGGDEKDLSSSRLTEMERKLASDLEQRAGRTLASTLGSGNFQVSITIRLDGDRQQTNETVFDPKSKVERSVRTVKQSGSSEDGSGKPAVGVEANVPREETAQSESEKRRQREDRREELVNFELNTKTVQTVREGFRVQRIAIAAVVNRRQIISQLGSNADPAAITNRLAELKRLIAAATGANLDNGDTIELSASDIDTSSAGLAPAPAPGFLDHILANLGSLINAAAILAVVVILTAFGLRPMLKTVGELSSLPPAAPAALEQTNGGEMASALGPPSPMDGTFAGALAGEGMNPMGAIGVPSTPDAEVRARLESLVMADEVKVAKVLKSWISEASKA